MGILVADRDLYSQLADYTLSKQDPEFIHQEVVDAYAAQYADQNSKPVYLTFALVGLYLYLEKGYTGKQVQKAHMVLAKKRKDWPKFPLPENRGEITIKDVLAVPIEQRDEMIKKWCQSAWAAYKDVQQQIKDLVQEIRWSN